MEEIINLKEELEKARAELSIFSEISNAMRTSLRLDEVLYIILTGVTSHTGLGFNRAMLFLVNEKEELIEGKMGIGPPTGEDADRIWRSIEKEKMDLYDLIDAYKTASNLLDSQFNRLVRSQKLPLKKAEAGILSRCICEAVHYHINKETINKHQNDPLLKILKSEEFVCVPLQARGKMLGVIVVDNTYTKKTITKDDIRILNLFTNQAGLAIENSYLYEQQVLRAHIDSLTRLWNHGYFQDKLQNELNQAKKTTSNLGLIMIDIDNFKNYNDTLGHQAGDGLLSQLAQVLTDSSRKMDYVCRYGGEEFGIILPKASKKETYSIAERLRQAVADFAFAQQEIQPNQNLTISLGVACFPEDAPTKSELINSADRALYEAKRAGKNKASLAKPSA